MVYKIRNKSFFWTINGWKNNYNVKTLLSPTDVHPEKLSWMISYSNHHSFLRAYQAYRNMSRTCK